MSKRLVLDVDDDSDYQLIGIATTLKDYRLAYYLNKDLLFNLVREDDFQLQAPGLPAPLSFSFFTWKDPDAGLEFFLVNNKNQYGILIPEQKAADFLLVVKGYLTPKTFQHYSQAIRNISQVQTTFLPNTSSKKVAQFLVDLELHWVDLCKLKKSPAINKQ